MSTAGATTPSLALVKYALDNGLEVILHEDHRQPLVAVNVWYHVGAFAEEPGKSGFAHLFEHLMFQGSAHVPGDKHARYLEEVGVSGLNGTTDFDRTAFFETVPKNELELALWLEADRMGWLAPALSTAVLDERRAVVKDERRQRFEDAPYGIAREKLWHAVFPPSHPYRGMGIGSIADLDNATLDDVRRFYDSYYAPSNATLCIAGDIDPLATRALVDKYFGTLPPWPRPRPRAVAAPTLTQELRIDHEEAVGTVPLVEMLWLTPGRGKPGHREVEVLARVLGDGIASKMRDALLVQSDLAVEVAVVQQAMAEVSTFSIMATVRPEVAPDEVLNTIQSQLDYLADVPVAPEDVARAVKRIESERVFALQETAARADVFQNDNHYAGDPGAFSAELSHYRAITADAVMAALAQHLVKDRRAILVAVPKATSHAAAAPSTGAPGTKEAP
ncbi:MAG: insulinase family protein [Deltaproteobacteria bacterium]|nr:insulinase family protein [Deltaproteobacteria bacterium]